jgi:hypothetical protein
MMGKEELDLYTRLQPTFVKAMGEEQIGDWVYHEGYGHSMCITQLPRAESNYNLLRLPLPIDPINPERGMSGMIKGFRILGRHGIFGTWDCERKVKDSIYWSEDSDTPTLALLKALAAQEGV